MDSGSDASITPVLIAWLGIVEASSQAVELAINEAGEHHVSRHNPYHHPHSCLARSHS